MIEKQELLKLLKEAYNAEEMSIPVYMRHLKTAVFWTGVPREEAEKTRKLLNDLAIGSNSHKKIVMDLINKVKESNRDAF